MAFAGRKVIQDNVMTRKRAKQLDHLIMTTAMTFLTPCNKLFINQVFQSLSKVDKHRIRSCLRRNGFAEISGYTWEKRNGEKSMGKTSNSQRKQEKGFSKAALC
jgi:hypothetical protein